MHSYDDLGKGDVLLLLHGLGNHKLAWSPQHPLSKQYRLVIPDMIGHGDSPIQEDISLDHAVNDIISLMDSLNIEQFHICGLSLGGILAQELYRQYPHRIKSLILSNTCSYIPLFSANFFITAQESYLQTNEPVKLKHVAIEHTLYNKTKENLALANKCFDINKETYIPSSKMAVGRNYFPLLPLISVPVLIIASTQDKITPFYHSYMIHRFIFNSNLVTIEDAGHLSNIERPDKFNSEILNFLQLHFSQLNAS
ncbi:hypothetical protein CN918_28070 [Priestia megaterium]|nr:hypothetical protein CN918_28070 [Priestia megaterium]